MSKIVCLSKEFLLELLNTHCFANLPEDTNFELLSDEEKDKRVVQLKSKIADLEAKLSGKEKEIEIKTEILLEKDKELEYYKSWFADDDYEKDNQDKISFAVEQLEKVKEFTDKAKWVDDVSECVVEYINDQIKQLKGVRWDGKSTL